MGEIALRPSYWASVSGGKDSLYMLKLILNNPDKYILDGVCHFELEVVEDIRPRRKNRTIKFFIRRKI